MNKEEWIKSWTTKRFKESDPKVIIFIADILYHNYQKDSNSCDVVYDLFAAGYCYYFALMLKDAFKRGEIVWHKGYSHIVWLDESNIAYDIGGVFEYYAPGDLVPISELDKYPGRNLDTFKHII